MTAHYIADTERLGLGRPDHEPLASEYVGPIVDLIAALVERGHAYAAERRRLLPRAHARRLRRAVAPRRRPDGPGRGGRGRRPQAGPARLRALEGAEAGRGHGLGLPVGPRPAGLAHRVLGDGRGAARGRASTSTAAASTSSSPTTRTRRRRRSPRADAARAACGCTTACSRPATARRCRSRSATSAGSREALDDVGARRAGHVLLRRPLPPAARVLPASALRGGRGGSRAIREAGAAARRRASRRRSWRRSATRSSTPWRTTSTRRARWRRCSSGSARPTAAPRASGDAHLREMLGVLGLENLLDADARPRRPRRVALAERRAQARAARGLGRGRPAARRAARAGLGGSRRPQGRSSSGAVSRPPPAPRAGTAGRAGRLRPQRRCARRCAGARRVHAVWATDRAAREVAARRAARDRRDRRGDRGALRLRRPPGRLRRGRPLPATPTPPSCSRAPDPVLVALDEVTDPQNLGAICRTAECAGATGV